jgi:lipopolysaccharide heptosyltransferase II
MCIIGIFRQIRLRPVKKTLRWIKAGYFFFLGLLGESIFFLGRLIKVIPKDQGFLKDKVKNILVIRTDRIGDVICSLPAVKALRENFPQSSIIFLSAVYTKDLLEENNEIDHVIALRPGMSVSDKISFVNNLKKYNFDLAVILSPFFMPALFSYLAAARSRLGYPLNGSGFLLTHKADINNRLKHEVLSCLEVTKLIGVDTQDIRPCLSVSPQAQEYANEFFKKEAIADTDLVIGIHPGASWEYKRWNQEGFSRVADDLIERYKAKVILFCAEKDKKVVDKIASLMRNKPIIFGPGINLLHLAAMIKKCRVFLGNNSGPMHIAAAVGTPVVAIFGSIHPLDNESKWAPYARDNIIVRQGMYCRDCHPGHCPDHRCIKMIKAQDVLEGVLKQLEKTGSI